MTLRMRPLFRPHGTLSKAGIMSGPLPGQGRTVSAAAAPSPTGAATPGQILRGHGRHGWKDAGWDLDKGKDAPVDPKLCRLLQTYGELSQATYDNLGLDKCAKDWGYATKPPGQLLSYLTKDYPLEPAAPPAQSTGTADLYMLPSAVAGSTLSPIINALPGSAPDGAAPKLVRLSLGELVWDTCLSKVFAFTAGLLIGAIDYGNGARALFCPDPKTGRGKEERGAFMGYVAVSKPQGPEQEVDVVIVWRGTIFKEEWQNNFAQDELAAWQQEPKDKLEKLDKYDKEGSVAVLKERKQDSKYKDVFVHQGFDDLYNRRIEQPGGQDCSPREVVREWLHQLMQQYNVTTITTTGHSLGGGLATICAFGSAELMDRKWDEWQKLGLKTKAKPKVTLVSFAAPRVGNYSFGAKYRQLGGRALRIANKRDIVPRVPGIWIQAWAGTLGLFNHRIMIDSDYWLTRGLTWGYDKLANALSFIWPSRWGYFHVGQMLEVDSGDLEHEQLVSPSTSRHNLELYIHMVSRKMGRSERNLLLLNKSDDLLVDQKTNPANWWGVADKRGCKLDGKGRWNKP